MAVTSMWHISSHVDYVIDYIKNPEKTVDKPELSPEAIAARKTMGDVIDYAENGDKTEQMMYVTGINCFAETAAEDFMRTKRMWGKEGGRLAYHGYQSFREGDGEMTPQKAHEIGVKMAEELWGDRFEVVVATHLNTGHLHNHYVLNSVSFVDGYKYRRTIADYHKMREVSDRLCREERLHVVEDPAPRKGKDYGEWEAEKKGCYTVRGRIRDDIDSSIICARCEHDVADCMKYMIYEFKFDKKDRTELVHPGIKPPGAKSFFRFKSLGENYDFETIRRRVIENSIVPGTPLLIEKNYRKWEPPIDDNSYGLAGIFRRYCLRLYTYVNKPAKREYIPMALREDIRKLDDYIEQMDFLYGNKINDTASLETQRRTLQQQLKALIVRRRKLYSNADKASRQGNVSWENQIKSELRGVNKEIRETKKKIDLCDRVFISSDRVLASVDLPGHKPEVPKIQSKKKNLSL